MSEAFLIITALVIVGVVFYGGVFSFAFLIIYKLAKFIKKMIKGGGRNERV